jgi:hypothetical protein
MATAGTTGSLRPSQDQRSASNPALELCYHGPSESSPTRWRGPRQPEGESDRADTGDRTIEIGPREEPDVGRSDGAFTPVDMSVRREAQPVGTRPSWRIARDQV